MKLIVTLLFTIASLLSYSQNVTIKVRTDISGGDTTIFSTILDSTGQPNTRVLYAKANKIASNPLFLYDDINNKVVINSPNISIDGTATKLYVGGIATVEKLKLLTPIKAPGTLSLRYDPITRMVTTADTTIGGGGGGTPAGATTQIQYNNNGVFGADSAFRWSNTGFASFTKKFEGLRIIPTISATANSDTLITVSLARKSIIGSFTGVKVYDIKINKGYLSFDSLYNLSIGAGTEGAATAGNTIFLGNNAGSGATAAASSVFLGVSAGSGATNASNSTFIGPNAGLGATNASNSNFFGNTAGNSASAASSSNFFGLQSGQSATNANNSNFFGLNAGAGGTSASFSNFFGNAAGQNASSASVSNFFGPSAGASATNANRSNFFGNGAGQSATNAEHSNFFGEGAGLGATGASYSLFIGNNVGKNTTHIITGSNNIVIGTNITTPAATTSNTFNFGNVLYGTNTYATTTGNPSNVAQTIGQVGINTATPNISSVLDIVSTTKGFLPPRLTTLQRDAIVTPATGLQVFNTTTAKPNWYNGTIWEEVGSGSSGGGLTGSGVANRIPFWTGTSSLGSDTAFRYSPTGLTEGTSRRSGFTIGGAINALAINDTIAAVTINTNLTNTSGHTGVIAKTFKIGSRYIGVAENNSFTVGSAENGMGANTIAIGFQANGFSTGINNIALGNRSLYQTNATANQIGIGENAGFQSNAARLIAIGRNAASGNSSAVDAVIVGTDANGNGANQISIGNRAGASSGAANSIFLGASAGEASSSLNSIFIGSGGPGYITSGSHNIFLGRAVGNGNFYQVTGSRNIVIGDAVQTPAANSNATLNIGNVLYGANLHNTGAFSNTAQTNGRIGINISTPNVSAALDVTSTTQGVLFPRLTTLQRDAIVTPATSLLIYNRTDSAYNYYDGVVWKGLGGTAGAGTTGGSTTVTQNHTTGTTVTINNTTSWLIVDPASALSNLTITMPATPTDGQLIDISFGGTISTTGAAIINSLLVVANTGQQLVGTGTYGLIETEDHVAYRYNLALTKWFRH